MKKLDQPSQVVADDAPVVFLSDDREAALDAVANEVRQALEGRVVIVTKCDVLTPSGWNTLWTPNGIVVRLDPGGGEARREEDGKHESIRDLVFAASPVGQMPTSLVAIQGAMGNRDPLSLRVFANTYAALPAQDLDGRWVAMTESGDIDRVMLWEGVDNQQALIELRGYKTETPSIFARSQEGIPNAMRHAHDGLRVLSTLIRHYGIQDPALDGVDAALQHMEKHQDGKVRPYDGYDAGDLTNVAKQLGHGAKALYDYGILDAQPGFALHHDTVARYVAIMGADLAKPAAGPKAAPVVAASPVQLVAGLRDHFRGMGTTAGSMVDDLLQDTLINAQLEGADVSIAGLTADLDEVTGLLGQVKTTIRAGRLPADPPGQRAVGDLVQELCEDFGRRGSMAATVVGGFLVDCGFNAHLEDRPMAADEILADVDEIRACLRTAKRSLSAGTLPRSLRSS